LGGIEVGAEVVALVIEGAVVEVGVVAEDGDAEMTEGVEVGGEGGAVEGFEAEGHGGIADCGLRIADCGLGEWGVT
jgi:hypothetical protein